MLLHQILWELNFTEWALYWQKLTFARMSVKVNKFHWEAAVSTGECLFYIFRLILYQLMKFLRHMELGLEHILKDGIYFITSCAEPDMKTIVVNFDIFSTVAAPDDSLNFLALLHRIILYYV